MIPALRGSADVEKHDAFIAYPTNRVVGTIGDPKHAQAAIEALLQVGFAQKDIDILHSEEDLHRPDRAAAEQKFLAQFQRTLIRTLSDEHAHLQHYVDDVRKGRSVIMVLAKKRDEREHAADILGAHGAESLEFYGRWSWHSLEAHPAVAADDTRPDPVPGRIYAIEIEGSTTKVRWDSDSRVTLLARGPGSPDLHRLPVTHLKPHLVMITWQELDRTTNVHVYDFDTGEAHAVISYFNRSVHRATGTVRRA
jgi:hypothetical protein